MIYLKLVAFAFLLATGQILFKQAALRMGEHLNIISFVLNGWLTAALVLYGAATILWVLILRTTPLSIAYPFAALGFIIVPIASYFIFKEEITLTYIGGALLICVGIIVTNLK